ncbi:antirestriction protein ArdA [uncultured Chryseobacterium sp.]|uniref:antirestriction protein ArdA n=1 Tax=uncultured Chryseobacterium sp. TaxID=259322 RepID=UPI0025ECFC34|nr:antirestriction protein ArdA [uncultured Chryseobacterium sp.]
MANLQNCLDNCSLYVGAYKKYNEGSIFGEWLNLSDYSFGLQRTLRGYERTSQC